MATKRMLSAALLLCACGPAAQSQDGPAPEVQRLREPPQKTTVEIGVRVAAGDTGVAKFSEYRDLPNGIFIRNLNFFSALPLSGYYLHLRTRENSERDLQSVLTAGAFGRRKIVISWDRLFHTVPTLGRNTYQLTAPGKYVLPGGFQALQGAASQNLPLKRDAVGFGIFLTPRESWDFRMQYSPEKRAGYRPVGNNFMFTAVELPEPVQYRTDDLKLSAEFARPRLVAQASSQTSLFHNDVTTLEWTGPFQQNDPAIPSSGRKALAPNNEAQNFTFAGALDLARAARLVATVSPGWMRQNAAFVPFTSNTFLQAQPNYPALPAASLNGDRQTLMMNYLLTGRVKKQFSYDLRYRAYRLDNQTPSLLFSNSVITDSELPLSTPAAPRSRRNLPYGYTRQSFDADWIWAPNKTSSAKVFYQWESWDRTFRDVLHSDEHTAGASWDWTDRGGGWGVQALLQHGLRRPRQYNAGSIDNAFPAGTGFFTLSQLPRLRRFDEAERSRTYGSVTVQAPQIRSLQLSSSYHVDRSFFNQSGYGDLFDLSDSVSCDLSYPLSKRVSVFADYTFERLHYALRDRQRLDAAPTVPFNDSANNDWESNIRDWIHTWGAGVNAGLLRNRLTLDAYYSFSQGANTTATVALGNPALAGFLVSSAEDYPRLSNRFQRLTASAKFALKDNLFYRIQYEYERYGEIDLALDRATLLPELTAAGAANAGFWGMTLPRYRVQIWSFSLGYSF